jgi:hypothetical protein
MKRSIIAATIVATVVGGSSATAARLITGKDIRDGSITARDIREGGITLNRLTPGAQALLRSKSATTFTGNSQSAAVKGEKGDKGETGNVGAATSHFAQHPTDLAAGTSATIQVFCPAGKQAIGGGIRGDAQDSEATTVTSSRPSASADSTNPPADGGTFLGWRGTVQHNAGSTATGIRPEIWAICVDAPATP